MNSPLDDETELQRRLRWVSVMEERAEHYKTGVDPKDKQFFHASRKAVQRLCRITRAAAQLVEATDSQHDGESLSENLAREALDALVKELA